MQLNKLAFTLIELLVVIAIIGILSGLIVVSMSGVTQKANIAKGQVFSNSLRNTLMLDIVSEWKFDEKSGTTTADAWNSSITGTISNFTDTTAGYGDAHTSGWMSSSNCVSETCLRFDGSTNYIITTSFPLTGTVLTFEAWAKIKSKATGSTIISDGSQSATSGFIFSYRNSSSNVLTWQYADGSNFQIADCPFFAGYDDAWVLIDIVADYANKTVYFYRNGVFLDDVAMSGTPVFPSTNRVKYIGRYNPSHSYALLGAIDNLRIYNAVIPTSQIKETYYSGLNSLLANGSISEREYLLRLNETAQN